MIVLDTHVFVWWIDDNPRLKSEVRSVLDAESDLRLCTISLLEIATAVSRNRLVLKPDAKTWLEQATAVESLQVVPLTAALCLASVQLPGEFHRDPADRLIVALARDFDAPICTADGKILRYPHVRLLDATI